MAAIGTSAGGRIFGTELGGTGRGSHPRYVRRITPADDGVPAGRDDNEKVAKNRSGKRRPGRVRRLAGFFFVAEERPVASGPARAVAW